MNRLRTASTRSLIYLVAALAVLAVAAGALAMTARGGGGPTPPPKPLADALHDGLAAMKPEGVTAHISFTNRLFPSGSLLGSAGSALMSGASGRLWLTKDGRGRLELQSSVGDVQVVWSPTLVTVYDASANTVYRAKLPRGAVGNAPDHADQLPSVARISSLLSELGAHASISGAQPSDVAGQPAYTVSVSPKHDAGLLGSAELAWDAARGIPLRIAIYAQGSTNPVLELKATDISYGPIDSANVDVSPPAGAKTVDVSSPGPGKAGNDGRAVTGLAAVTAKAGFPVNAPATLVGLPRQYVRLVGGSDSPAALAVYGHGLGAIVVVERAHDAAQQSAGGPLTSLPAVAIAGATGHELATALGTAIEWRKAGVDYVLAGSLPPAAAEAAARALS